MDFLRIEPTESTPTIDFDPTTNLLVMAGDSYPENAAGFYAPVLAWLDELLALESGVEIVLNLNLNYFNSSSSAALLDLLLRLEKSAKTGRSITVNWRYHVDNDLSLEYGEGFQLELPGLVFNLIEWSD